MLKLQSTHHVGQPVEYSAEVIATCNDCLSRQVAEGVEFRVREHAVMNTKIERHQPALWRIRSEVERV